MKDILVAGSALFAMFFGAGNLIFPPALGFLAGKNWFFCMLGFFMTGVGLPILGVAALAIRGGSLECFAGKVSITFAKVMGLIVVLAIGPLLAIPRTGATVYEIGIKPMWPSIPPLAISIVFFAVTLFFVIKPSTIIDKIGKYLTPALLLIIALIVAKGIFFPIGTPQQTGLEMALSKGFVEGYQTMDALASILFAGLVLKAFVDKGYATKSQQLRLTCMAGLVAGAGLMFVYGGLLYLGATATPLFEAGISRADLIVSITGRILGWAGQGAMCLAVSAACLTTAIGLTAVVGSYLENISKGKLAYRPVVIATALFSTLISVSGVEQIVTLSVPLLIIAYPVVIVLIALTLAGANLSPAIYRGAVVGALLVSICNALTVLKVDTGKLGELVSGLPLADSGFGWILPALVLAGLCEGVRLLLSASSEQKGLKA
ncbi:MAG: branched-chain amino acid transport system II carrier protein [Desulfobacterales bacterium]|nr:branched-chain amino acid transport system II carrier protein [Desulfobacterales bacterium]